MGLSVKMSRAFVAFAALLAAGCQPRKGANDAGAMQEAFGCAPRADDEAEARAFTREAAGPEGEAKCRAAILVYHHLEPHVGWESGAKRAMTVSPAMFERQMRLLRDGSYAVVPFGDVVDCLTKGTTLPDKAVVITFDDGWESPYVNALPVLEKHGYTATFFVVTNMLGDGKVLLSWAQVKALDGKKMTIGSHTRTHPFLTRTWGPRLTDEVAESKRILEKFLGHPVPYFAYPFGQYDARVVKAVRDAGYEAARGTWDGTHHRPEDLYALKAVYASEDFAAFARDIDR